MTVKELRDVLNAAPDHLQVIVRAASNLDEFICADVYSAGIETAHDEADTEFFAIDADQEEREA